MAKKYALDPALLWTCRARIAALLLCTAGVLVAGGGCGDDDEPSGSGTAANTSPSEAEQGPLYAISGRVYSPDFQETTSLLWLTNTLESGALRIEDAIELPGNASLWGFPLSGDFYVASGEELTLTKYAAPGGKVEARGKVGFSSAGVTTFLGETVFFVDAHRGFIFDPVSLQAFELNLDAMVLAGTLDIARVRPEGADFTGFGSPGFRKHGDRFVAITYGGSATYDRVAAGSKLVFFDPITRALDVKDAPCGGLNNSVQTPDGDVYFATDTWATSVFVVTPSNAPAPCLMRLPSGSDQPDSAPVALSQLTGGMTGGIIPGPDGTAFVRVLEMALYKPSAQPSYSDAFSAPIWQTWRLDLEGTALPARVDRPLVAGGLRVFEVDGQAYENESTADFGSTTLIRTTGAGAPARALVMPGVTWGIVRIR